MKVLNIGSMNIDYVYSVDHIILPGETESTGGMNVFLGGKGINQSMALAKAGAEVYHAGLVGEDGQMFLDACKEYGVNSDYIQKIEGKTGHTIIQVDKDAQNSILLFGGANRQLTESFVDEVLSHFDAGDILLLHLHKGEEGVLALFGKLFKYIGKVLYQFHNSFSFSEL